MPQPRPVTAPVPTRQERLDALLQELRPKVDAIVQRLAEQWVDTPEHLELGAIEYTLRDAGQEIAATVHHTGLASRKKRGTSVRARSAATATVPRNS
jgi:hypothetical protein